MTGDRYPTTSEVASAASALTESHPGLCGLRTVGRSREGRPLLLLSVGHGRRNVLVVAGAHANEAGVGGATVLRLADRVAHDRRLREAADAAWHFLLCVDPDGAHRNETELVLSPTVGDHFRHFFRPHSSEQPEWLVLDDPLREVLPETRCLVGLIDELRPVLQCSLHGIDVGGVHLLLTDDLPGLSGRLGKSAAELDIPLELGSADAFYWADSGPGVYLMPPPGEPEGWDAVPSDAEHSTWAYARRYGGVTAIIEAPMWGCERSADISPAPDADRALRAAGAALRRDTSRVARELEAARPFLPGDGGPLLRAVEETIAVGPRLAEDWDPAVRSSDAAPLPPMTTARLTSVQVYAQRLPLRAAAMLRRLRPTPELDGLVADWSAAFEAAFDVRWIPVADQSEQQARTAIAAFESLRT
ncbi:M14 family zinc carboxypeptidase [Actinacidiphila oryziradicis]|uniref:M14 family zinc carboxypeptidase n=1 Tax=Actinacidiphila oryziradicis TaxID=2571141 RepID=UPI0023F0F05C|nr:M14 family zinc carboxypeptidase [Actinacidiphila oryziradicis]MCW2872682.1 putative carboxypeptidase [Actinacidiphila oryziradicis]